MPQFTGSENKKCTQRSSYVQESFIEGLLLLQLFVDRIEALCVKVIVSLIVEQLTFQHNRNCANSCKDHVGQLDWFEIEYFEVLERN